LTLNGASAFSPKCPMSFTKPTFCELINKAALKTFNNIKALLTGSSLRSFFRARFQIKGIYFLDEPETALSPKSQIQLLRFLRDVSRTGHAQFIIATHSPILMSVPGAAIYIDKIPIAQVDYEETSHYKIYKAFMETPNDFLHDK
jgi:predicted ATPase